MNAHQAAEPAPMTVWQLLRVLLAYTVRGRARQPVYVAVGATEPHLTRAEFNARMWPVTGAFVPYVRRDCFVLVSTDPSTPQ